MYHVSRLLSSVQTHGYTVKDLRRLEKKDTQCPGAITITGGATGEARLSGTTGETVSAYIAAWNAGGPNALVPRHSPRQPTKIPPKVAAKVRSALEASPAAVGDGVSANWDSRVLQAFLRDRYGITMSRGASASGSIGDGPSRDHQSGQIHR